MADTDYSIADRAKLTAESLGIHPASFAGRDADALTAMALLAGYRRMPQREREQLLSNIAKQFSDNPAFVSECSTAAGMMVANPTWVPGSLTEAELEKEIDFWRNVKAGLDQIGAKPAGSYLPANNGGIAGAGKAIAADTAKTAALVGAAQKLAGGTLVPKAPSVAGPFIYSTLAATVTQSSLSDLQAEVKRRGQLGTMSRLELERYSQ